MPSRLPATTLIPSNAGQSTTEASLFTAGQWRLLQENPFHRFSDEEWAAFSPAQRDAVLKMRVVDEQDPASLFPASQWRELQQNPNVLFSDAEWSTFSPAQRSAIIALRREHQGQFESGSDDTQRRRNQLEGGGGGSFLPGSLPYERKTLDEVMAEAQQAPDHPEVKTSWTKVPKGTVLVQELNAENLFREADAPNKRDEEFTPEAGYTKEVFYQHLQNVGKVIKSLNGGEGAHIVGLVEVEDLRACEKLIQQALPGLGYHAHLVEGEDERGIDVALLTKYPLWPGTQPRLMLSDRVDGERGILRVEVNAEGKRLVVYVNHWKSMRDGEDVAATTNAVFGQMLREDIDLTTAADPKAAIVVLGDFNTKYYQGDQRAMEALKTSSQPELSQPNDLYDATHSITQRRRRGVSHPLLPAGTHDYRGDSDFLDRIIVNKNARLDPDSVVVIPNAGRFFGRDRKPNTDGVSDHKSLVAQLKLGE